MADVLLAQLAKEPVPGKVKTRLQPALSATASARLHTAMVQRVCNTLCGSGLGVVELWVDGDAEAPLFKQCMTKGVSAVKRQRGADLGDRMAFIVECALARYPRVLLVGSDCPGLSGDYLANAINALDRVEVVFGPALDGGYVLLGLSRACGALFRDMPWGSDKVLAGSLARLEKASIGYELLEPLADIDRPEDLAYLPEDLRW